MDSHLIVTFQMAPRGIKSDDIKDIELAKRKEVTYSDSKMLNFDITIVLIFKGIDMFLARLKNINSILL